MIHFLWLFCGNKRAHTHTFYSTTDHIHHFWFDRLLVNKWDDCWIETLPGHFFVIWIEFFPHFYRWMWPLRMRQRFGFDASTYDLVLQGQPCRFARFFRSTLPTRKTFWINPQDELSIWSQSFRPNYIGIRWLCSHLNSYSEQTHLRTQFLFWWTFLLIPILVLASYSRVRMENILFIWWPRGTIGVNTWCCSLRSWTRTHVVLSQAWYKSVIQPMCDKVIYSCTATTIGSLNALIRFIYLFVFKCNRMQR